MVSCERMELTSKRLAKIPHASGVYVFTRRRAPVYVGKAADLRQRLMAYRPGGDWKTDMLREATGLRIIRTDSELEAVLLEANWIKTKRPKYNIDLKDQKSFLLIEITDEEFPQVRATRRMAQSGTYYGPFTSAYAVRETLRALRKIFPYRCARTPIAPIAPREPGALPSGSLVRPARSLAPIGSLALRRGRIHAHSVTDGPEGERPASRGAIPSSCLYFHLGQCAGTCAGRITATAYRRRVITPLTRLLEGKAIAARRLLDADHRRLLDNVLAHTRILSVGEKYAADVHDLQRALALPRPPRRIEAYDISHIHGIEAVGSMVVALDGEPAPSEYKKFKIRTLEGQSNDVGMMAEMLTRRLRHLGARGVTRCGGPPSRAAIAHGGGARRQDPERGEHESWPTPDLIVIDGGKPQLNAVVRVMRRMDAMIPVVALAKRLEEVYFPDQRNPLRLPGNSPALHLLQRVRDEAHRFSVGYHRFRRTKRMLHG